MSDSSDRTIRAIADFWGVRLAAAPVCAGHSAPLEFLVQQVVERPPVSLWCGPRGGGKSFISGLGTWIDSLAHDGHGTRILGGSLAQSEQIYNALTAFAKARPGRSPVVMAKRAAHFPATGSDVSILAASPTSVRGPHVARLRLDEVDEIAPDIRESAMGMCMSLRGIPASVVMTSTWHRVGGPMTELIEKGRAGAFPVRTFCAFEVLERCPEERSGPNLEKCPECPLFQWCYSDMGSHPSGLPKAKRSNGHYAIDSLIQKTEVLSRRVFESDYLCLGPKADGVWFKEFGERNVSASAEFDPALPVHVAVDSGVFTGAVLFQLRVMGGLPRVNVFGEYLAEGVAAYDAGLAVLDVLARLCPGARRRVSTDSAGGARNPVGPTVFAEYRRAGLVGDKGLESWPKHPGCVIDGLALLEALIRNATGEALLTVHPRSVRTIAALRSYARAKRAGQWQDHPEDPQHPHEDLVDALRGGLKLLLPDGVKPRQPRFLVPGRSVF